MTLYFVTLNYHNELHTFYTASKSERGALLSSISRLAKKLKVAKYGVRQYLLDGKDRWRVNRIKEVR